jgi:hypothetical protein
LHRPGQLKPTSPLQKQNFLSPFSVKQSQAPLSFLPPEGNNTGRKTIRISCVAAVGTNSESKRYLPREKGNSPLTGERGERKDPWKAPGPECGRVFKPHARFSRFMGRLAKIFDPNLRIYSLLEDEPGLRYRKNIAIEELSLSRCAYYESRIARSAGGVPEGQRQQCGSRCRR